MCKPKQQWEKLQAADDMEQRRRGLWVGCSCLKLTV